MTQCTNFVCKYWFKEPDDEQPDYSFEEYDIYSHIQQTEQTRNNRLSLRKNLTTGYFEAYRQFMQKYHSDDMKIMDTPIDFTTQIDTGLSEIAFSGSFDQCI